MSTVVNYQCPQCGAPLAFSTKSQQWDCEFCLGSFPLTELEQQGAGESTKGNDWSESAPLEGFSEEEAAKLKVYSCPQCGAQMVADETSAASNCPYCGNLAVFSAQLSGDFKPEWLIPFKHDKDAAKAAFLNLCKGKKLLPSDFTSKHTIDKLSGVYVPFWLFDCDTKGDVRFHATQVTTWEDAKNVYTKTDYYAVRRGGTLKFQNLPVDGSAKMDDELMGAVEPYDLTAKKDFNTAYLSGFLAEKYDQDDKVVFPRAEERIEASVQETFQETVQNYATVSVANCDVQVEKGRCQYAMLPVWMLNTSYQDKQYHFAMNGQTGKIVGNLPVSMGKAVGWFAGIMLGITAVLYVGTALIFAMGG